MKTIIFILNVQSMHDLPDNNTWPINNPLIVTEAPHFVGDRHATSTPEIKIL